jgi:hypothetical protein
MLVGMRAHNDGIGTEVRFPATLNYRAHTNPRLADRPRGALNHLLLKFGFPSVWFAIESPTHPFAATLGANPANSILPPQAPVSVASNYSSVPKKKGERLHYLEKAEINAIWSGISGTPGAIARAALPVRSDVHRRPGKHHFYATGLAAINYPA